MLKNDIIDSCQIKGLLFSSTHDELQNPVIHTNGRMHDLLIKCVFMNTHFSGVGD